MFNALNYFPLLQRNSITNIKNNNFTRQLNLFHIFTFLVRLWRYTVVYISYTQTWNQPHIPVITDVIARVCTCLSNGCSPGKIVIKLYLLLLCYFYRLLVLAWLKRDLLILYHSFFCSGLFVFLEMKFVMVNVMADNSRILHFFFHFYNVKVNIICNFYVNFFEFLVRKKCY